MLEVAPKQRWAIEIKRSISDPKPSRGFYIACEDINATLQIVLYPGDEMFKLGAKTTLMSLQALLSELPQKPSD